MEGKWKHSFHQGEDVNTTSHINEYIKLQKNMKLNVVEILTHREKGITLQVYEYKVEMRFIVYTSYLPHFISEKKYFCKMEKNLNNMIFLNDAFTAEHK